MILHVDMEAFYASGLIQQQIFDQLERKRHLELDRVADQIAAKFGQSALRRGTGLGKDPDQT